MWLLHRAALALTLMLLASAAGAQGNTSAAPEPRAMGTMPMHHPMGTPHIATGDIPTQPGQAAFAAIQEIAETLQADPDTDWSKVDVDALRQHLIDMDEVTMRAAVRKEPIDNGLRIEITGVGRTLEAIKRMVPDHAREIDGMNGWTVRATSTPDGVALTVTTINPNAVQQIRALGFAGILVQGGHHQRHHLAMAKGEPRHTPQ